MMHRPVVCVLFALVVGTSACWLANDGPQQTPIAPIVDASPSPTPTPEPTATLAPVVPTRPPMPSATATPTAVRMAEIKGYGYVPHNVRSQARRSHLVARVRHLSVEPSFRINPGADPEYRYIPYAHFSFNIIETLRGTPAGDVVVVEYRVGRGRRLEALAVGEAMKWIGSKRDAGWNKREAIIFLDDLRFAPGGKVLELSSDAQYSFADYFSCHDSQCPTWDISSNDFYDSWVWLPSVEQDASPEVPDSERMFRVVVKPYGADDYRYYQGVASLADIKAILETYSSEGYARGAYLDRQRSLWEAKGSDSYSFVYSIVHEKGVDGFPPAEKIVVRNGEVVEVFFAEDVDVGLGGKVWPAGSRIEPDKMGGYEPDAPTLETALWDLAEAWARGDQSITHVSFDYENGFPTAVTIKRGEGLYSLHASVYVSNYTPLDN